MQYEIQISMIKCRMSKIPGRESDNFLEAVADVGVAIGGDVASDADSA